MFNRLPVSVLLPILCLSGCASQPAKRGTASAPSELAKHIEILQSIPLVQPVENPEATEGKIGDEVAAMFASIQHEATSTAGGKLERGTHAKGSCFNGSFRVFTPSELGSQFSESNELIARLRRGVFAIDGTFPAKIRFANAMGTTESDVPGDVRGFSFVVDFGDHAKDFAGENLQDFMLNNTPMFAVNNAHEFVELVKALRLKGGEPHIVNPLYIPAIQKALKFAKIYQTPNTKSYATEQYWSNLPYTQGVDASGHPLDLAKFKAVRCDGQPVEREAAAGKAPNFLQADILARSSAAKICFLLQVQLFDLKAAQSQPAGDLGSSHPNWTTSQWIENGGELWDESVMPFQTIAKIEFGGGDTQISCDDWYVNTRLHSNPQNQPVGSVARVRTLTEEKSRARRMGETP